MVSSTRRRVYSQEDAGNVGSPVQSTGRTSRSPMTSPHGSQKRGGTLVYDKHSSSEDSWEVGAGEDDGEVAFHVGIDLGTTNSSVALWHLAKNRVKILKLDGDKRSMPSCVFLEEDGTSVVGHEAIRRSAVTGRRVISSAKRVLGLRRGDPALQTLVQDLPITVLPDPSGSGGVVIQVPRTQPQVKNEDVGCIANGDEPWLVSPEHISCLVLQELKARADSYIAAGKVRGLTEPVDSCVITVPVHFPEARRRATRAAAHEAGFRKVVTLGESTAAAMAYGLHVAGSKIALTFDFGGGTTDVTVLSIADGGKFQVLTTVGDPHLGGEDMDQRLVNWVLEQTLLGAGVVASMNGSASGVIGVDDLARLRMACAAAKISLSEQTSAKISFKVTNGATHEVVVTREKFEDLCEDLIGRAKGLVLAALEGSTKQPQDIAEVVLAGGCSRIPSVREMLRSVFGGVELCSSIDPDLAVVEGAAIRGAVLSGVDRSLLKNLLMLDALPLGIAIRTADGSLDTLLPKSASIPATAVRVFRLHDNFQPGVTIDVLEVDDSPQPTESNHKYDEYTQEYCYREANGDAHSNEQEGPGAESEVDDYDYDAEKEAGFLSRFTFMLSEVKPKWVQHGHPDREVEVTLHITAEGLMKVKIKDSWEELARAGGQRQVTLLACYLVLLFVAYLCVKIRFAQHAALEYADAGV